MSGRVSECEDTPFMGEFAEPTSLHDAEWRKHQGQFWGLSWRRRRLLQNALRTVKLTSALNVKCLLVVVHWTPDRSQDRCDSPNRFTRVQADHLGPPLHTKNLKRIRHALPGVCFETWMWVESSHEMFDKLVFNFLSKLKTITKWLVSSLSDPY
jgi:hypothetical protein